MSFLFHQGEQLVSKRTSLIQATEEIQLNATSAHLWFEEIMSGDASESIDEVWRYIDAADWYAKAMLEGASNSEGNFYPLKDIELRADIIAVRQALKSFKSIAQQRYINFSESIPGSSIDSQLDTVFHDFMQQAELVQTQVQHQINRELRQYRYISMALIFISAIMSILLSNFLYNREKHRAKLLESLTQASSSIEQKNKELHQLAHYDSLTGLPNRILFQDRLEHAIAHATRTDSNIALLFIDLDNFKYVNDQYGHQAGDELLKLVSHRITDCVRIDDTVVRISGDEFVVILPEIEGLNSAIVVANKVAETIVDVMQQPFYLTGPTVYISSSIGVALYPEDSSDGDELIKLADNAMYHAKETGKNNFQFYSDELNRQSLLRLETERDLRAAIEQDQFIIYFHPQWSLDSNKINGLEVLVRWQHPTRGLVSSDQFIGIAESCGLIDKIDFLIMTKAIQQHKLWQQTGLDIGVMAINVSSISFSREDFFNNVSHIIEQCEVDAKTIELEITESILIENDKYCQQLLTALKSLGVRVAIDDFGTGYSSMAYLKNFEVDTLKIDQSFIADFDKDSTSEIILKNMISLGIDLGLTVVAEGIETPQQQHHLRELGCHSAQGFLLTKPKPAAEIEQFIRAHQSSKAMSAKNIES